MDTLGGESLFRAVVDYSPTGVLVVDRLGVIRFANREAQRVFGYAQEELIGQSIELLVPHYARQRHTHLRHDVTGPNAHRVMGSGRDLTGLRKDGRQIPMEIGLAPFDTDEGTFVIASIVDISLRRHTEQVLRDAEERFRQLVENIKEAFIILEVPSNRVAYVSRVWADLWGRPIDDADAYPQLWVNDITPSAMSTFRIVRPDGTVRWARSRTFPVHGADGRIYRTVGLVEDITDIRLTEEQLLQSQKSEAIGQLAGGVAHDFNNLLTAILGYSTLLVDEFEGGDQRRKDVEAIAEAAQSAAWLTRQLLAFSRRQMLEPQRLDLNAIVQRLEGLLRRLIGEHIELVTTLDPELRTITADPGQIEQIVMNLVINARDAMPNGGSIVIETTNEAHAQVALRVSDNGTGMDEVTQRRIFEPFFTTKRRGEGTGLGLSTVYGIVTQSGGSIDVKTEKGRGSTFTIRLPSTEVAAAPTKERSTTPATLKGSETILIADDQSEVRAVATAILRRHGYTVIVAGGGSEALRLAEAHAGPIDLLITDVVMTDMSGNDLVRGFAEIRPLTRILYVSGYTGEMVLSIEGEDGGPAFLQKPFTPQSLLRKVRDVLER